MRQLVNNTSVCWWEGDLATSMFVAGAISMHSPSGRPSSRRVARGALLACKPANIRLNNNKCMVAKKRAAERQKGNSPQKRSASKEKRQPAKGKNTASQSRRAGAGRAE